MSSAEVQPKVEVEVKDGYILERYQGRITPEQVHEASEKLRELYEREDTPHKILIDLLSISYLDVTFAAQLEGMQQIWLLKNFEQMALVSADKNMDGLIEVSVKAFEFDRFKIFRDRKAAIDWLKDTKV